MDLEHLQGKLGRHLPGVLNYSDHLEGETREHLGGEKKNMLNIVFAKEEELGTFEGLGPLGTFTVEEAVDTAINLFNKVMSNIVGFMTIVAGIWFIFQFIIGAFGWLTAAGDKAKVQASQTKITHSIIGLAIVVAAVFLIDLIGTLLGLKILSPGEFIKGFWN